MTKNQNARTLFLSKPNYRGGRMLCNAPQKKGVVRQLRIQTPRKPNSARRNVVKLFLTNKKHTVSYVPGGKHNLKRYSTVIIRAGGARDLPGVYSICLRGLKDLQTLLYKKRRRSLFALKKKKIISYEYFMMYYY